MARRFLHAAGHDLRNALLATVFFGATLNNYLAEAHGFDAAARGWLEVPRELPGFLIMFITGALLTVASESQMASLAMLLTGVGAAGLGFLSPTTAAVVVFVAIWSLGDHVIFAVEGPIALRLPLGVPAGRSDRVRRVLRLPADPRAPGNGATGGSHGGGSGLTGSSGDGRAAGEAVGPVRLGV